MPNLPVRTIDDDATAITASEWLGLGVALATALGVYAVPNEQTGG